MEISFLHFSLMDSWLRNNVKKRDVMYGFGFTLNDMGNMRDRSRHSFVGYIYIYVCILVCVVYVCFTFYIIFLPFFFHES